MYASQKVPRLVYRASSVHNISNNGELTELVLIETCYPLSKTGVIMLCYLYFHNGWILHIVSVPIHQYMFTWTSHITGLHYVHKVGTNLMRMYSVCRDAPLSDIFKDGHLCFFHPLTTCTSSPQCSHSSCGRLWLSHSWLLLHPHLHSHPPHWSGSDT